MPVLFGATFSESMHQENLYNQISGTCPRRYLPASLGHTTFHHDWVTKGCIFGEILKFFGLAAVQFNKVTADLQNLPEERMRDAETADSFRRVQQSLLNCIACSLTCTTLNLMLYHLASGRVPYTTNTMYIEGLHLYYIHHHWILCRRWIAS